MALSSHFNSIDDSIGLRANRVWSVLTHYPGVLGEQQHGSKIRISLLCWNCPPNIQWKTQRIRLLTLHKTFATKPNSIPLIDLSAITYRNGRLTSSALAKWNRCAESAPLGSTFQQNNAAGMTPERLQTFEQRTCAFSSFFNEITVDIYNFTISPLEDPANTVMSFLMRTSANFRERSELLARTRPGCVRFM